MEPKLPTPNSSPERGPAIPGNSTSIEYEGKVSPERPANPNYQENGLEQAREQLSGIGGGDSGGPQVMAQQVPQPIQKQVSLVTADDTPLVAADDDLIEKAWVDKAKMIVVATRDDPYTQEKEVSKLQADYLKKRYGKEIKLSN